MGFEVEIKFRVADRHDLMRRLEALGAVAGPEVAQEDSYLSHPARDFAATDEALRVRRDGPVTRITYKGPKRLGPTKTREEIEVPLVGGDETLRDAVRILDRLGFRPVAVIRKRRTDFRLARDGRPLLVALDLSEGLGAFAEVEALARDEDDLPACQAAVLGLAADLGLSDVEPRSYLRMTLERWAAEAGDRPGGP